MIRLKQTSAKGRQCLQRSNTIYSPLRRFGEIPYNHAVIAAEGNELATQLENTTATEMAAPARQPQIKSTRRAWPRVRFRMWAILFAPLLVAILLLLAFPKLLTGDFVEATVVSIKNDGNGFIIEMDTWKSSQTDWGASLEYGPFSRLGTSSGPQQQWSRFIPTWPKHNLITVNLGFNRDKLPPEVSDPMEVLTIKQGETYRADPGHSLTIAIAKSVNGQRGKCVLNVSRGSRLGL